MTIRLQNPDEDPFRSRFPVQQCTTHISRRAAAPASVASSKFRTVSDLWDESVSQLGTFLTMSHAVPSHSNPNPTSCHDYSINPVNTVNLQVIESVNAVNVINALASANGCFERIGDSEKSAPSFCPKGGVMA